jgi:flagellar hook-associated protein 1 FlgK
MSANSIAHTSLSALQSAQAGMALTAQNVEGLSTAGFTRRRMETGVTSVLTNGVPSFGQGASVAGFARDWSSLLQQQRISQAGVTAFHGSINTGLAALDREAADPALAMDTPINNFFSSLAGLARNPADGGALADLKARGAALLSSASQVENSLNTVRSDARANLAGSIDELNALASDLVLINRAMATNLGGSDAALLDRRDFLLLRAGQVLGDGVSLSDKGFARIFVDGQPLVNGEHGGQIESAGLQDQSGGRVQFTMRLGQPGQEAVSVVVPLRADGWGGALGGQLRLARDPSVLLQSSDAPDPALQRLTVLFDASRGKADGTADPLSRALSQLAAWNARAPGTSEAQVNAAFVELAKQANDQASPQSAARLQEGLLSSWRGLVSKLGAEVSVAEVGQASSAAVERRMKSDFESQSGVNLDEEAANLLRYQQVYSAASRLLQANASMLDEILAVVGR